MPLAVFSLGVPVPFFYTYIRYIRHIFFHSEVSKVQMHFSALPDILQKTALRTFAQT